MVFWHISVPPGPVAVNLYVCVPTGSGGIKLCEPERAYVPPEGSAVTQVKPKRRCGSFPFAGTILQVEPLQSAMVLFLGLENVSV